MPYKEDLQTWVLEAVDAHHGEATLVSVAEHIWEHRQTELRAYGEAFYTWQYDMRWAAQYLRDRGVLSGAKQAPRGVWRRQRAAA
jgi:hypothetical protein